MPSTVVRGSPFSLYPFAFCLCPLRRFPVPCCAVQGEPVAFGIVSENLPVTAPIKRRVNLPVSLFLGQVFLDNIPKELQWHGVVRLGAEAAVNLLKQRDVRQRG